MRTNPSRPGPKPRRRADARPAVRIRPSHYLTPASRRMVRELGSELKRAGVLNDIDIPALNLMAQTYDFVMTAAAMLRERGLTEADEAHKGTMRRSPAWVCYMQGAALLRSQMGDLGLTPRGRVNLNVDPEAAQAGDAFERFLQRRITKPAGDDGDEW